MVPTSRKNLVWVVWRDAQNQSTRNTLEDIQSLSVAQNCNLGWIIHENAERIVLAHGTSSSGEIDHFVIPANCIVSVTPVYPVRQRKKETND